MEVHRNCEDYNPAKERKALIVLADIVADIISNKKYDPIVTELFVRGRKLNIPLTFVTQSYVTVPKDNGINSVHYFVTKISNKRVLE